MTATKDGSAPRPASSHRLSMGSTAPSMPNRPHSHSVSLGSLNPVHRVNRRKSSSSMAGVNMAALAAAAKEASHELPPPPQLVKHESNPQSDVAKDTSPYMGASSPITGSFGPAITTASRSSNGGKNSSTLIDGPSLSSMANAEKMNAKVRVRRASEGSRLSKGEKARSSGGELRCETCGKGYKHGSCLTKHLWEHTPEWSLTSKLLISKHQQVQLLEAASVLVTMNQDKITGGESAIQDSSDHSSESQAASGSEARDDEDVSSRTSTPSQVEEYGQSKPLNFSRPRRQDSYSSAISRSYQSNASSAPNEPNGFHHYGQWASNMNGRPSTAGQSSTGSFYDDDRADVEAAAAGLLSCSLGTPNHGPKNMPADVPPVPPLPAKFARRPESQPAFAFSSGNPTFAHPPSSQTEDIAMADGHPHQEDDDGVFGRMEQ